ncbi:unnamed protein product [Choristocarpus tenellus]
MKELLKEDLKRAPPFPEVVGSRRMLRFLRGHKYDVAKAASMMKAMLQWREENGVDQIREDIVKNKKFNPRQFPQGDTITKLFPVIVANPLCVSHEGLPLGYESYGFSPRKATGGNLNFFIHFHIYCQEFKQLCLDSLSDAREIHNLAKRRDSLRGSQAKEVGNPLNLGWLLMMRGAVDTAKVVCVWGGKCWGRGRRWQRSWRDIRRRGLKWGEVLVEGWRKRVLGRMIRKEKKSHGERWCVTSSSETCQDLAWSMQDLSGGQ